MAFCIIDLGDHLMCGCVCWNFYRTGAVVLVALLIALVAASPTKGWSGRSLSLLDPYVI
jgi:hypothetical protein